MPLIDSRLTNEAATEFLTTEDGLDYLIRDEAGTITEGAFDQSATWAATAAEMFVSTATFAQGATWDAVAAQTLAGTATWAQEATWDAVASSGAEAPVVVGRGAPKGGGGFQMVLVPVLPQRQRVALAAAFSQAPETWTARVRMTDDELVLALA